MLNILKIIKNIYSIINTNYSIINTNDVYNTIVEFNDYYINRKIEMLNIHYNRND